MSGRPGVIGGLSLADNSMGLVSSDTYNPLTQLQFGTGTAATGAQQGGTFTASADQDAPEPLPVSTW